MFVISIALDLISLSFALFLQFSSSSCLSIKFIFFKSNYVICLIFTFFYLFVCICSFWLFVNNLHFKNETLNKIFSFIFLFKICSFFLFFFFELWIKKRKNVRKKEGRFGLNNQPTQPIESNSFESILIESNCSWTVRLVRLIARFNWSILLSLVCLVSSLGFLPIYSSNLNF